MMTKTFDSIYESSAIHSQFLFVRLVFVQFDRFPEPPPFNLLRIPVIAVERLVMWTQKMLQVFSLDRSCASIERALAVLRSGLYHSHSLSNARVADSLDTSGRYVGSNVDGQNSWETWKSAKSEGELKEHLGDFVARHADDVAQEERWRTKMTKRIANQFDITDSKIEKMSKLLNGVLAARADSHSSTVPALASLVTAPSRQKSRPSRIRARGSNPLEANDLGGGSNATDARDAWLAFSQRSRNRGSVRS